MYRSGEADLDGDGAAEIFFYVGGRAYCGSGGCNLYVLRETDEGFETVARTTITRLPVGVLDSQHNGMRDIVVSAGGGGMAPGYRVLRFDGQEYPSNPSVAPAEAIETIGRVVIPQGELLPIEP